MQVTFRNGFAELDLPDWASYLDFVSRPGFDDGWIYRGHERKSYRLTTSLTRACMDRQIDPDTPLKKRHLRRFRDSIRGRLRLPGDLRDLETEIWAVGQHHGLATPLLDWTESPVAAAYFAFLGSRPLQLSEHVETIPSKEDVELLRKEPRSVFALNAVAIESKYYSLLNRRLVDHFGETGLPADLKRTLSLVHATFGYDEIGIAIEEIASGRRLGSPDTVSCCHWARDMVLCETCRVVRPQSGENPRLVNQRGLFTFSWVMHSLERLVEQQFANSKEEVLLKINLPNEERPTVMRQLEKMNVNYLSLFPDVEGAAMYCNTILDVGAAQFDWSELKDI